MEQHAVFGCAFMILFVFKLEKLSCFQPPQGNKMPYMTSDVEEISGKSYDYIVVGGGTTGCSLAATLSEKFSVLLVERGGSPYGNPLVTDKMYYGFPLIQTDKYTSVAQSFVSEDGVTNHRGRVLGGSSAINGGFYSRASYDFILKAGWDKELVREAYEWVESRIVFKPELTPWQTVAELGFLESGFLPYNGYSLEHVEGTRVGGSIFDECGKRHTSADLLGAGNPENITVLLNATVKNVMFHSDGNPNKPRAGGIRFMKSDGTSDNTRKAYLKSPKNSTFWGDIILSAGALGSPQILLLSGIGPPKHLQNFSIPLLINSKQVGRDIKDNPGIAILVDSKPRYRFPDTPQVVGVTNDYRIIIEAGIIPISINLTRMPIASKLAFTDSKGKLRLKNTDPRQNPSVKFNYLSKEMELKECVKMVQMLGKVVRSQPVDMFLGTERKNELVSNEHELRVFCKKNVRTFYHYHGGCVVGSVVDRDFRVNGVLGLRVVDGSILSESPGANPMATLLMLGRYQGIKILEERKKEYI